MSSSRNLLLAFVALGVSGLSARTPERVTVRPADNGRALVNPGMGWTMHYYSNIPRNYGSTLSPDDTAAWFPGCSTVYLRIPWAYVEPEEGVYNWAALDTPAQRWLERGGQVAFRITCSESWLRFATPEWVRKAGAKGVFWDYGKGVSEKGQYWDPDFVDPVFLAKLKNFLTAMAARYDGRPEVAFIDIGSYGLWGEGHTEASSCIPQEKMNRDVRAHIDLYVSCFPHTRLCISDDVNGPSNQSGNYPLLDYARSKGVSFRDDSILVQRPPKSWFHADQAERYWRTMPVVLEHEHYGPSVYRKAWSQELLLKSIEDYHASFMSIHWDPRQEYAENKDVIAAINRRLGYRFQLRELDYPAAVKVGAAAETFEIAWSWANAGVAPCYEGAFPALTVKDSKGSILAVMADEGLDLRALPVAAPDKAEARSHRARFALGRWESPVTPTGNFEVYVSAGRRDGTPIYELPLPGNDGHRRYRVGAIRFE